MNVIFGLMHYSGNRTDTLNSGFDIQQRVSY